MLGVYSVQFCVILSVLNINQDIGLLSFYSSLHNTLMLIFRFLYLLIKAMVSLFYEIPMLPVMFLYVVLL